MEDLSVSGEDLLAAHDGTAYDMVIVTVRNTNSTDDNGEAYDFVSRCFDPWTNVLEDPVTGKTSHLFTGLSFIWLLSYIFYEHIFEDQFHNFMESKITAVHDTITYILII